MGGALVAALEAARGEARWLVVAELAQALEAHVAGRPVPAAVAERALEAHVALASSAGAWTLVADLAAALEVRRREREPSPAGVVDLAAERERRGST
ncbi:MAG: hypothetical protein HY908_02055 [Myxococcales bacterium]|nr:hypothetical protein [Myxococcales bacterium]